MTQHVVATAGHVDHGKSTLVRALTGTDPDRWAEEKRRGLTIDLGFAWAELAPDRTVAFVDVPGHERFVGNMLAGAGPVPAVLLVVAADEGWMPQTAEHVAALDALGVRHAVLAVTRADLADPRPVAVDVTRRLQRTSLAGHRTVHVSATSGEGVADLSAALVEMTGELPAPDTTAPVRLWVDRSFTIRGAGTVVTGTLTGGRLATGDELLLHGRPVTVRGLESLGRHRDVVPAVARVAVNLRGATTDGVRRGDALLDPGGTWTRTDQADVRTSSTDWSGPTQLTLHVGSAAVPARVRPLGPGALRLTTSVPLPLRAGDVGLLRDPGGHAVVTGVTVLDPAPRPLRRRGDATRRAAALLAGDPAPERPDAVDLATRLEELVRVHRAEHPLDDGVSVGHAVRVLGLAGPDALVPLVRPPLRLTGGRVVDPAAALPPYVLAALDDLDADLDAAPFTAPDADRLRVLRLGPAELAAAERAGRLLRIAGGVVLRPDALDRAVALLSALPAPFSVAEARTALASSRRVVVPLLERLDRAGRTSRDPDDRRRVVGDAGGRTPGRV